MILCHLETSIVMPHGAVSVTSTRRNSFISSVSAIRSALDKFGFTLSLMPFKTSLFTSQYINQAIYHWHWREVTFFLYPSFLESACLVKKYSLSLILLSHSAKPLCTFVMSTTCLVGINENPWLVHQFRLWRAFYEKLMSFYSVSECVDSIIDLSFFYK